MQFVVDIYDPQIISGDVVHQLMASGVREVEVAISSDHVNFSFSGNSSQVDPVVQKISEINRDCPVDVLKRKENRIYFYNFTNGRVTVSQENISPSDWAAIKGQNYSVEVLRFLATTTKTQSVTQFSDFLECFVQRKSLLGIWTFEEIKNHVLILLANLNEHVSN